MNYRVVVGLLLLVIIGEAASPYLTSVLSSASEVGTASLVISNTNSSGGYSYANTTVTYLQSYSFVPNVAYGKLSRVMQQSIPFRIPTHHIPQAARPRVIMM